MIIRWAKYKQYPKLKLQTYIEIQNFQYGKDT
jgi:hypothetical protein